MLQESQRQLILESEFTAVVFGEGENFVLTLPNDDNDYDSEVVKAQDAGERGMKFCGILVLTQDGLLQASINSANPDAVYAMCFAWLGFVPLVVDRLRQKAKGDSVAWLTQLYRLPDTRT